MNKQLLAKMNEELYASACDGWCDPAEWVSAVYAEGDDTSISAEVAEAVAQGASHADIEGILADFYED